MHLIGLDVGTTGCKVVVFDQNGGELARAYREYGIDTDERGKAEQDAEEVWRLACQVVSEAVDFAVEGSGALQSAALSVSVQGDAIIAVDSSGQALCPAQLGMDYRPASYARHAAEKFGEFELFERTGMRPHALNSFVKLLWLRDNYPDAFRQADKIVTYADYVTRKLGGDFAIDLTMASRTMAFNLKSRRWDEEILRAFNVPISLLSQPVESGTPLGRIDGSVARVLGLPAETVFVAGAHDQPAGGVGSGVVGDGTALDSTGTAEVLSVAFPKPALSRDMFDGYYPCYLHAVPGQYFTFALNHVGGMLLRWYRDNFSGQELEEARRTGKDAYEVMLSKMPAGPSRLMVLPHFNGSGTPWCDMDSLGAIVGLTLATTRHDVVRAIVESQTYELKINLERLGSSGVEISRLVAAGGGARSTEWLRAKANILDRPVSTLKVKEAACMGAAIMAGSGAGLFPSIKEGAAQIVRTETTYMPDPELAGRYREYYERYKQIYPALKPVSEGLRRAGREE